MDWNKIYSGTSIDWNKIYDEIMASITNPPVPEMLPLEDYQKEAIKFILLNWGKNINPLCALDVGMGKTRVACKILSGLFSDNISSRLQGYALICCSTTGTMNSIWVDTLKAYSIEPMILEGEELRGIKMKGKKVLTIPPLTVCLVTYATIINDNNIEYLINTPPNLVIFDEYHTLTNNSSSKNKKYRNTILRLPDSLRLALTATPFVNEEMEIVPAYGLLNDTELVNNYLGTTNKTEKKLFIEKVKEIKFWFYKANQYNLTPVSEWLISIPMGGEHHAQYLKVRKKYSYNRMSSFHQISKLSVSPVLVENYEKLELNPRIETTKITALRSIVSRLPAGDKIVICDNYRETLNYIMVLDFMRLLKPRLYIGGAKAKNKENLDSFIYNPEYRALLTTRQEGGEGVNLQAANHIVLMNCWFTVKDIIQIVGRIKRKGQKKPVYAYILGYNLYEIMPIGMPFVSYVLEEDESAYRMIRKKKEIYEDWGMSVEYKLPPMRPFFKSTSFEDDFGIFVDKILKGELSKEEETGNEKSYLDDMHSQFDNQVKRKVILLKKKGPSKWKKETDINIKHISYEEFLEKQKAKDRADIGTKSSTLILFHEPKDNNTDQTEPTPKTAPQTASPPDMQPDVQGE